jgi:hypothetical protein
MFKNMNIEVKRSQIEDPNNQQVLSVTEENQEDAQDERN